MATYVLACADVDFDPQAGTCVQEQWVLQDTWTEMLPTMEESTVVGSGLFLAVCAVLAASLLFPPRDMGDD